MDSQRKQSLQSEILSELKHRGFKNWTANEKTPPDETVPKIDFKLTTALSSDEYPAKLRELEIENKIVKKVNEISLPKDERREIRQSVTRDLETAFGSYDVHLLSGERVANDWHLYGSYKNGLCCNENSDIDFHNGSFENLTNFDAGYIVRKIRNVFYYQNNTYFDAKRFFDSTPVPLVELKHKGTGKVCSITFSGRMGVDDSVLAELYVELYPNLKVVTLFLKYVLEKHNLHGTKKIKTHTIFWLVVFFMQQKKLLPPGKDVRQAAEGEENNAGYSSEKSIVSLYHGFLEFYKNFNFLKYVISPYFGYALPIGNYETLGKLFPRSCMNIQGISTRTANLAANVPLNIVNKFRVVCEHLFDNCEKAVNNEEHPFVTSLESKLESKEHLYKNSNHTAFIDLDYKSLEARSDDLKEFLIAASRNLMEIVLGFHCESLVTRNIVYNKQGDPSARKVVPFLYIDYSTTNATLCNKHMLSMFEENSSCLSENFGVFFLFEARNDLKLKRVRVLVEGDGRFVEFMETHGKELFIAQVCK